MSTSASTRGRKTRVRMAYQTAFATAAAEGFRELHTYSHDLQRARGIEDDDVIGAGFHNDTDDRPAGPGLEDAQGSLLVPFDLGQIGYWLTALFGPPVTTGAGPYVHTYATGSDVRPTMTIERQLAAGQFDHMVGAFITRARFPIGPAAGFHDLALDLGGQKTAEPYGVSIAGAPEVLALSSRVPKSVGIIKVAGVRVGKVLSATATIENQIGVDRFAGDDAFVSFASLDKVSAGIEMTARYDTDALRLLGNVGANADGLPAKQEIEFEYSLGAGSKLSLLFPAVRFNPVNLPVTNGGRLTQTLSGRCEQGLAGMVSAILTNATAAYAAA